MMYDCSKEFLKFYQRHVVLPAEQQNHLRKKRRLNINRLKKGLEEYNEEKGTDFKIAEERIQGSMAMHTIVQNDSNDFDIDVGIVFEADNLADRGAESIRNMFRNALERKTNTFTDEPEVKTSCVRLKYSEGYHVDFAIFKRHKEYEWDDEFTYEHAGNKWSIRDIKALEEWFSQKIKEKGIELRQLVRLSKMFCKSRDTWGTMPSGLIQTVICEELFDDGHERIDETFYYTMKNIVHRLSYNLEVKAPVDNNRLLTTRQIDLELMERWKNKLESCLKKLDVLFDDNCTYKNAITAWHDFFNHSYWKDIQDSSLNELLSTKKSNDYDKTEQFIEDLYPAINEKYYVKIDCRVTGKGFSLIPITKYLEKFDSRFNKFIPSNFEVRCEIDETNCPSYDKVLWKVKNVGNEAKKRNCIRGQIEERGKSITEPTSFVGPHYIECYLIKDSVCVAIGHVDVPIGENN